MPINPNSSTTSTEPPGPAQLRASGQEPPGARDPVEAPAPGTCPPTESEASGHPTPSAHHPEALVRQFHRTYHLPIAGDGPSVDRERVHLRMALVAEEFAELMGAVYGPTAEQTVANAFTTAVGTDDGSRDVVGAADALGDLVYVIYGMALECGIPLDRVLAQVQASNMSKLGPAGEPIYRADGKVLKGPGYFPPDVAAALGPGPSSPPPQ